MEQKSRKTIISYQEQAIHFFHNHYKPISLAGL